MVEIDITYEGDLHCRAVHGPSGATLVTDAPKDNQGKGEAFSPTDLAATSLGVCMMTVMGIKARDLGVDLAGSTVKVTKEMVADPFRRIGRLGVTLHLPANVGDRERTILEATGKGCPVARSLGEAVQVNLLFEWGHAGR